ncbi:MAG: trigger factor [Candidatus Saccharimonadales bacterium]
MQVSLEQINPTRIKLIISADATEIEPVKEAVVARLSKNVKVQGFRTGKAPKNLIEKQLDQSALQTEVLEQLVNNLYVKAVEEQKLRPVAQPSISITKFVPYTTLEFAAESDAVGEIKLADYKKIKLAATKSEVTAKDVNEVLENLRGRGAVKEEVTRTAKDGDEVVIDFAGTDAKTKEAIAGADGKDYPLVLGSKNFIPGFEDELIGLKAGEEKTFDIVFPADYGAKALQSKKVTFKVTVHKVQELKKPALDDTFAASIGPFKTVDELKADIKKQLKVERDQEAQRKYDNDLLQKIAEKSDVAVPEALVQEEMQRMEDEEKQNIMYRGQTWQEHLDEEGLTAEQHLEKQRPNAELRVKGGLILGEIAEEEHISVTPEEHEIRMQLLKGQYQDPQMQAELDKPENRRDIMSRMLTEKTLDKLREYAQK